MSQFGATLTQFVTILDPRVIARCDGDVCGVSGCTPEPGICSSHLRGGCSPVVPPSRGLPVCDVSCQLVSEDQRAAVSPPMSLMTVWRQDMCPCPPCCDGRLVPGWRSCPQNLGFLKISFSAFCYGKWDNLQSGDYKISFCRRAKMY